MSSPAQPLYDRSVDEVRRGQVRQGLSTLLEALAADPAHRPAYEAAGRICRVLGSAEDAELFEALAARPEDAGALFALGWRLNGQGRPEVAVRLLERSLAAQPADTAVRRELAFARLQARDFTGCLRALAPLEDEPDLSETERLDVLLVQAEAAFLAGRRAPCAAFLERAEECVPDDAQRERLDALHAQLGRAARWTDLKGAGLREWHFIQHAGVLLKTAGGWFEDGSLGGRFGILQLRGDMLAFLLQRLLRLCEALELRHEAVAPASPLALPLAHAVALRTGATLLERPDPRGSRSTLLVAAAAGELAEHLPLVAVNRGELRTFAVNLDWEHDAPACPDVAGVLARRVFLPWEPRYAARAPGEPLREVAPDARAPEEVGAELAGLCDRLPWEDEAARAEFEAFYRPLRDELVLCNPAAHPARRRFTALSPCWPAGTRAGTAEER